MNRFILHCDLDCFFAAVEIRDNPQFKGKPVIIGADPKEGKGRGVISTCSYEARIYGLHSGMPISHAYRRYPHGIYLKPNFSKYLESSKKVMNIIEQFSDEFQKVGIDEAYLDLSKKCSEFTEAKLIAKQIQKNVYDEVGLTISIGCAPTKSLAKIASDYKKPNGITIFGINDYKEKIHDLDITRIPGIGKKTKAYYYKKGYKKIGDIINSSLHKMIELFGKHGKWVWQIVNGIDNRRVQEFHGTRKSISAERTFFTDTYDFNEIISNFETINKKIHETVSKNQLSYKTITLKIRFENFQTFSRSKTLSFHIQNKQIVLNIILELFKEFTINKKKIRLVGIKLSNFEKNLKARQTNLLKYAFI